MGRAVLRRRLDVALPIILLLIQLHCDESTAVQRQLRSSQSEVTGEVDVGRYNRLKLCEEGATHKLLPHQARPQLPVEEGTIQQNIAWQVRLDRKRRRSVAVSGNGRCNRFSLFKEAATPISPDEGTTHERAP